MNNVELIKKLSTLSLEQINLFTTRCVLRALPALAQMGERFPFWGDEAKERLFSVLLACNAGIAMQYPKIFVAGNTVNAARMVASGAKSATAHLRVPNHVADTAISAIRLSLVASRANVDKIIADNDAYDTLNLADFAAYSASASKAANAAATTKISRASSAKASNVAPKAAAKAADAAVAADILFLQRIGTGGWIPDLWHGNPPETWHDLEKTFISGLRLLELDYWADEYCNWVEGQFDKDRLERCFFMPWEIIDAGPDAMLIYLHSELVNMAEARVVFLGEGEAGKTSLIRRLHGEKIRGGELATPRVEIRQRLEPINGENIRIHYWDFGGQVVMHATHQFFLREKSVYVIVLDIRRCDSLEYWLDHVRVFAPDAPTLIVLNKVDSLPTAMATRPPFDINEICRRYPFVLDKVFPMSCVTSDGMADFEDALHKQIVKNYVMRPDMPVQLFKVKEALASENGNYIEMDRFDAICREQGISEEEIEPALAVLDNLGVAIHFPELRDTHVVLNPEWITKAIYYILWASEERGLDGKLSVRGLKTLFNEGRTSKKLDIEVPDDKCGFLLGLMTQFRLAFEIKSGKGMYCVPMLTPVMEPNHGVSREGGLQFQFVLPFLPPGLFYRFIAESGTELVDDWIWKTGAVLSDGKTKVLVEYIEYRRTITFYAHDNNPGIYLTTLRQRFTQLLGASYKELDFESYVLAPKGERINWRDMLMRYGNEGRAAKAYAGEIQFDIYDVLEKHFGVIGKQLEAGFNKERDIVINNTNTNTATANPVVTVSQTTAVSVTVNNAIQSIFHIDSALKEIEELLEDYKEDQKEQPLESEDELKKFEREITRLRSDIVDLEAVSVDSPLAEAKSKPIWERIKKRWDKVADISKQWYYVIGFEEKIVKIAGEIGKIDWPALLNKVT